MRVVEGNLSASGCRVGIVVSRFNNLVTEKLLAGALDTFVRCGGQKDHLTVVYVPGSFEIPIAARKLAESGGQEGILCLGCLIRGETPHFEVLAAEVTRGIGEVALSYGVPLTFGVLTTDTVDQALNRSGVKYGNKGSEAMSALIEMIQLFRRMGEP